MKRNTVAVAGAISLLVSSSIALAVPAQAAAYTSMPGPLKGMVLQTAFDSITDALSGINANVPVIAQNIAGPTETIRNYSNWIVCGQSPSAGKKLSADTSAVYLSVRRPGTSCS